MTRLTFSRRRFVQTLVGTSAVVGLARGQATTFELGGQLSGWIGRAPEAIADETNPTLRMQVGKTYVVAWENIDGEPHNFAIGDGSGNVLKETEVVSEKGALQTVEFTAKPAMSTYFSQVDEETMRGKIVTSQPTTTNGTATMSATTTTNTNTTTTTATSTTSTTTTPTATESTATQTGTATTKPTGTTTTDDGLRGFGVLAALGSLASLAYLLRRNE
ncbi:cupredoxin domain-containing protein [Haladaptatus sp. NG-SE-30]